MNGVTSLLGQQMPGQAQGPMPGMMPQQGAPTPGAMVAPLKTMSSEQLKPLLAQKPSWAILTAYNEALKREARKAALEGQQAQMAAAPTQGRTIKDDLLAQSVMAAHGGVMHGYAGGGIVALRNGGAVQQFFNGSDEFGVLANPEAEALDALRVEQAQKAKQRKSLEDTYFYLLTQNDPRAAQVKQQLDAIGAAPASTAPKREMFPFGPRLRPQEMESYVRQQAPSPTAAPAPAGQRRQPSATTASPATGAGLGALASAVEQTGTPAPDALSSIEAQGIGNITNYQDVLRKQGAVDPELQRLREAAYKSSQDIAARRGERAQAGLTAAQQQLEEARKRSQANIFQDPEALLRIASQIDTRRGKGLGSLAGGLSGVMGSRRAEMQAAQEQFQKRQDLYNTQQDAVDQLNQALAEKRVADMTGDVNQRRQADIKVAEAQLKVTDLRTAIQKERAAEEDRREGRAIQREQIRSQETIAELNRRAQAALRNMPGPEQLMTERAIKSLMDANPSMPYHEAFDKVRGAGKGLEDRAEFAALKQQATMLRDELKLAMEVDPLGKSQRVADLRTRLDGIYKQLGGEAAPAVGPSAAPAVGTIMQGYRFKGGNPADKNNWEKV